MFQSTSDSEILAHLIKKDSASSKRIEAILQALNMLEGAFAFVILTKDRLYCVRDKYGLRPLSIGVLMVAMLWHQKLVLLIFVEPPS